MPAPKLFLSTADIAAVTGICQRSAQDMMCAFSARGQTVKSGKSNRGRLVSINHFVRYLCEQDGEDPAERKRDIIELLKEINGGERVKKADAKPAAPRPTA